MKTLYFDFYDESRQRQVPVSVYLPEKADGLLPTIVFGPGYQGLEGLTEEELLKSYKCKQYTYLAEYFTANGYAFVSIQHDVLAMLMVLKRLIQMRFKMKLAVTYTFAEKPIFCLH